MTKKYLIRLDDACPTMNSQNWTRIEGMLDRYNIKPMVGIVPANADPKLKINEEDSMFWDKARQWQAKGWTIALHGYEHVYHAAKGGLNPLWDRSEFVGLSLDEQTARLRKGKNILEEEGLNVEYFFAPSHTFDLTTVEALKTIGIGKISDTIALKPYVAHNAVFIPQVGSKCRNMIFPGIYTFCFHPNTMIRQQFNALEVFLDKYSHFFIRFEDLSLSGLKSMTVLDKIWHNIYFLRRKIRH